jgi:DNA invertase Pin-like site-specific DNA recombinase
MSGTDPKGRGAQLRAARYIRVSRSDQNPQLQTDESEQMIHRRGWTLGETFVDQGHSGSKEHRPALDRMMSEARKRSFDILLVWRADRLFRSLKHMVNCLGELSALGIEFVSVTEPFDTTTPQGRLLFHILASMAEFERGLLIERTLAGMAAARRRGAKIGRPRKQVDMKELRRLHREGMSIRKIASKMNLGSATVHDLLKRDRKGEIEGDREGSPDPDTIYLPNLPGFSG